MIYLPIIVAGDYESLHDVLRDHIPTAYEKWLRLHAMWHRHYAGERIEIRSIHVSPKEFASHLKKTGKAANLNELFVFAEIVATGKTR